LIYIKKIAGLILESEPEEANVCFDIRAAKWDIAQRETPEIAE
jgi:hypothetical protein